MKGHNVVGESIRGVYLVTGGSPNASDSKTGTAREDRREAFSSEQNLLALPHQEKLDDIPHSNKSRKYLE